MKKQFLECGKIVGTHGLKGELRVEPWCDEPEFFCALPRLFFSPDSEGVAVRAAKPHKHMVNLLLDGIDAIEQAQLLRGKILYMNRDDAPESSGYFVQDLIGLRVIDADTGQEWGTLTDVFPTGANDVYTVTAADGRKLLVPVIEQVVLETDIDGGIIKIRPLEGLFDAD